MESQNQSVLSEFIFTGLTNVPSLQVLLFIVFLVVYCSSLAGNLSISAIIQVDSHLHMPIYFFISNLSICDACYTSVITPKMLRDLLVKRKTISFLGCLAQLYFFTFFAGVESFILTAMAYDRFGAICKPLHYPVIMTRMFCSQLVLGSYLGGLLTSLVHTVCTFTLPFCKSNIINHFFCDVPPLLRLVCADTSSRDIVRFSLTCVLGMGCAAVIVMSYMYIILAILKIPSNNGKRKAFSTCSSHLTVVSLFYGTAFFMYLQSNSSKSNTRDKAVSV
ncbi:olfactory receptor 5G25-like [Discoglossus pictus]